MARLDFPHPDSPASPSVSPGRSSKLTPRTAGNGPSLVEYVTLRSRTASSAASSSVGRLGRQFGVASAGAIPSAASGSG